MTGKLIICSVAILALGTYWSNQYGPKAGKFGDPWSIALNKSFMITDGRLGGGGPVTRSSMEDVTHLRTLLSLIALGPYT